MIFSEFRFFVFFAVLLVLYHAIRRLRARQILLLVASLVFYAAWDWRFVGLLVYSAVLDFHVGRQLAASASTRARRSWLTVSLVGNLAVLGFFKYYNFFIGSFADLLGAAGLSVEFTTLELILPVGISFYTFQTMSYALDIYRRQLEPTKDFIEYFLFVTFFPQLVAGPIVRAVELVPQIQRGVVTRWDDVRFGITRFAVGFTKKVLVADSLAPYVDRIFENPGAYDGATLWCASIGFAMQCYCDFAGYTDMAVGTGRLMGFHLPENFRFPFIARSVTDFWRRWHITLYSFMRDYLYFSLGGSKVGPVRLVVNAMITMAVVGLWHGADWNFLVWGVYNGVLVIAHRAFVMRAERRASVAAFLAGPWGTVLGVAVTNILFFISFTIFRADGMGDVVVALQRMLTFATEGTRSLEPWVGAAYLAVMIASLAGEAGWLQRVRLRGSLVVQCVVLALLLVALAIFCPHDTQAFVYFQF